MPQVFDTPLYTSDQSIDRVLRAGLPVLLVFTGGPTPLALDQGMKTMAKQEAGRMLVVQMDARENPQSARRFSVQSAPSLVTVRDGQVFSRAEDITREDLERHSAYLLGKGPRPEVRAQTGAQHARQQPPKPPDGAAQSGGQTVAVTDVTFEQEVLRSPVPVVVDFWAPWCGPCRMVAPTLDKLAREWNGRVKIAKINVDENQLISSRYAVTSIPTMMVILKGKVVDRWAGALPEPDLRSRLAKNIK